MVDKEEIDDAIETGTNLIGYIVSFSKFAGVLIYKAKKSPQI